MAWPSGAEIRPVDSEPIVDDPARDRSAALALIGAVVSRGPVTADDRVRARARDIVDALGLMESGTRS